MFLFKASWDSPPRPDDPGYDAFKTAFKRFVDSRLVIVPKLSITEAKAFDQRSKDEYRLKYVLKDAADLDLGQDPKLKLMPFQVGRLLRGDDLS